MATVIVSIFRPVHSKMLKAFNGRDYVAASVSTTVVFLGVLIPLTGFSILLAQQALVLFRFTERVTSNTDLSYWMSSLKKYLEILNSYLSHFRLSISSDRVIKGAASFTQAVGTWVYENISVIAANFLTLTVNFFLTVALVFVFFVSGGAAKRFVMELVPLPIEEKERVVKRFRELALAVFVGNGLISVLEGLLGGLSFFAFGIYGALIWGVVMAIASFLPMIGAFIVVIPAAIYLFLIDQTWQAIAFLAFNTIQLTLLETIVKPRLIGTKSQMHAALVFMSILAGVQIYGVFGLFYGPLLVTIFLAFSEIYKEHYRDRLSRT
jgi:predicted PurR-regulated permease PerM